MIVTFDLMTIALAIAISLIGVIIKPLFKDRVLFKKEIPLTKFLPYVLLIIGMILSFLLGDENVASMFIRGLTSTGLAVLGYDGVKALIYKKDEQ